jgi:hypothetical protein
MVSRIRGVIRRVSPLKILSRNSSDLHVFLVFPMSKHVRKDVFVGSSLWIGIQERLIRRVSPLKILSSKSPDLYVLRVFPPRQTCQENIFSWIMLVDPYSETTYQTSFPAKIP